MRHYHFFSFYSAHLKRYLLFLILGGFLPFLLAQIPIEKQIISLNEKTQQAINEGNYLQAIGSAQYAIKISKLFKITNFRAESYLLLAESHVKYISKMGITPDSILLDSTARPMVRSYTFGRLEMEKRPMLNEAESEQLFQVYMTIGYFYETWLAPNLALKYFEKAEKHNSENLKNTENMLKVFTRMAEVQQQLAALNENRPQDRDRNLRASLQYYTAIDHIQESQNIYLASERVPILNEIATIYNKLKEYDSAINTNMRMLAFINGAEQQSAVLNNIGYLYQQKRQLDSANVYFNKALKSSKELASYSDSYFRNVINLSEVSRQSQNYANALAYLDSLQNNVSEDSIKMAEIHNYKASVYFNMADFERAKKESEKALTLAQTKNYFPAVIVAYKRLSEVYKKWLNTNRSDEYKKLAHEAEKIYSQKLNQIVLEKRQKVEEREKMFNNLETTTETEARREEELERLKNEKALKEQEAKNAKLEEENTKKELALKEKELKLEKERAAREQEERRRKEEDYKRKQEELERKRQEEFRKKDSLLNAQKTQAELDALERDKQLAEKNERLKDLEAKQAQNRSKILLWVLLGGVLIVLLILFGLFRIRQANKTLAKQQKEILEKNHQLEFQKAEIQEKNEELYQQQEEIIAQRDMLSEQAEDLKEKSKHITESIQYAERIQSAMLPHLEVIYAAIPECFVLFKPRDIVSGDFYWFMETLPTPTFGLSDTPEGRISIFTGFTGAKKIITAIDCTGHGVPGAFMSMIGNELLHNIVGARGIYEADKILNELHKGVSKALKQKETENRDGMDMALCVIDEEKQIVEFAGAKNPLYYIQDGKIVEVKADKMAIGGEQLENERIFTKHEISIQKRTTFYMSSDGYQDQFGGPKGKKFMKGNFKNLLFEVHQKPFPEQKQQIAQVFDDWTKVEEQIDDVLVIGFSVGGE